MTRKLKKTWFNLEFFSSPLWTDLRTAMLENCDGKFWAPMAEDLFRPFISTHRSHTKVMMVGDGLTDAKRSDGLLYSARGLHIPFETDVVFEELKNDVGFRSKPASANLLPWAQRGVLLLPTSLSRAPVLTMASEDAGLHYDFWDDLVMEVLYEGTLIDPDMVFVLIGEHAINLGTSLSLQGFHRVIELDAPKRLLTGCSEHEPFLGSRVFSRVNAQLKDAKLATINWSLQGCNRY